MSRYVTVYKDSDDDRNHNNKYHTYSHTIGIGNSYNIVNSYYYTIITLLSYHLFHYHYYDHLLFIPSLLPTLSSLSLIALLLLHYIHHVKSLRLLKNHEKKKIRTVIIKQERISQFSNAKKSVLSLRPRALAYTQGEKVS